MKNALFILFALAAFRFAAYGQAADTDLRFSIGQDVLISSPGMTTHAIIEIAIPSGKHIYGNPKGPGTGKPTTVSVAEIPGLSFTGARYLPAVRYTPAGEKDFIWIYHDRTRILVPISVSKNTAYGDHTLRISVRALLCDDKSCMPRDAEFSVTVRVVPDKAVVSAVSNEEIAVFTISPDVSAPTGSINSDTQSKRSWNFRPRYISQEKISGILEAILFGLLAGFLLNFMPCVLPVVSLKLMSFVKHSGDERGVLVRLGLLFSLGILTTFAVLALLALLLGYNWGELFQKWWFIVSMITIVFALALSMFGLYTMNIPAFAGKLAHERENPYVDSYVKGLLATLLATPCSGPFLGGTLAWSFTQPPAVLVVIFMSVGAGMALPYLVLTGFPRLIRFIPRPGNWTITLEHIMAFLLIATDIYLINILRNDLVVPTLSFLAFVSLGLWIYGKYGAITETKTKRRIASILLVATIVTGYFFSFKIVHRGEENAFTLQSSNFSMESLFKNRDRGTISIVKFTADWCPNCILVEKTSLSTPKVSASIEARGAVLYTADITREHREAQELLAQLGSRSIPFLAVFPPGDGFDAPFCLRDIYSEDDVLTALEKASLP